MRFRHDPYAMPASYPGCKGALQTSNGSIDVEVVIRLQPTFDGATLCPRRWH